MQMYLRIDLLVYSVLIPTILLIHILNNSKLQEDSIKLFVLVLSMSIAVTVIATIAWIPNGINKPWASILNYWSNAIYFSINVLPVVAWVMYFDYKILGDLDGVLRRIKFYLIPTYISFVLVVINHFNGIVFYITENNIYVRGPLNAVTLLLSYFLVIYTLVTSRKYKEHVNGKLTQVLFWYFILPILGGLMQFFFQGAVLVWPMFNITSLLAFILIEKDAMFKDPLTNLSTRSQLEDRLIYKIKRGKAFSLIMIDLDDFKIINDTYGHDEGDKALIVVSSMLRTSVKREDTVCRYGGDEFMILIESSKIDVGEIIITRLKKVVKEFNAKDVKPYPIKMSFGYKFADLPSAISLNSILTEVDEHMYKDKARNKSK